MNLISKVTNLISEVRAKSVSDNYCNLVLDLETFKKLILELNNTPFTNIQKKINIEEQIKDNSKPLLLTITGAPFYLRYLKREDFPYLSEQFSFLKKEEPIAFITESKKTQSKISNHLPHFTVVKGAISNFEETKLLQITINTITQEETLIIL